MRTPTKCDRCPTGFGHLSSWTMSKFNMDLICPPCKDDERLAPGYKEADRVEVEAVRAGVRNFAGVGLSLEDRQFLGDRLAQRTRVTR
jgi:hypothetical protein